MKRRFVALVCAVMMLMTAFAAGSAPTLTVGTVTVPISGETTAVDVPITLSGNTGICGVTLKLSYDGAITLTGVEAGDALSSLDYTKPKDLNANPVTLLWDGVDNDTSNGEIIVLTFEVPSAAAGSYDIAVTYAPGDIYDGDLDDVDVTCIDGGIVVGETADVGVSTVNGAQIRTKGVQGLRFTSSIDKTAADFDRVVEFGTVLIPSADLADLSELVIGATLNGHTVAKVEAKNLYEVTEEEIKFTAVITEIAEKNYAREYTARAYAILDDGSVVYADAGASRSIYAVASAALADAGVSAADKAVFQAIVDTVENA